MSVDIKAANCNLPSNPRNNKRDVVTKEEAKALIFGFVHEHEKKHKHRVPKPINSKILDFYPVFDQFKWQKGNDADSILKIYNNGLQVMNDTDDNRSCIANHKISALECNEYSFEITLIDFDYDTNYSGLMIGIVNGDNTRNEQVLNTFNSDFSTKNRDISWTIYMSEGEQFCLYGPGISCKELTEPIYDFETGDRIKITLDMIKKEGYLYYNDKFVCNAFSFPDWNVVIPGLALWSADIALNNWTHTKDDRDIA